MRVGDAALSSREIGPKILRGVRSQDTQERRPHVCRDGDGPTPVLGAVDRTDPAAVRSSAALISSVAWAGVDGMMVHVNVWDSPSAVADFFEERVQPVIEADGPPEYKPLRHGLAVAAYFREQPTHDA